jgi:hypothetical protein
MVYTTPLLKLNTLIIMLGLFLLKAYHLSQPAALKAIIMATIGSFNIYQLMKNQTTRWL